MRSTHGLHRWRSREPLTRRPIEYFYTEISGRYLVRYWRAPRLDLLSTVPGGRWYVDVFVRQDLAGDPLAGKPVVLAGVSDDHFRTLESARDSFHAHAADAPSPALRVRETQFDD